MRIVIPIAAAIGLLAASAIAQGVRPAPMPSAHHPVCLWTYMIDHTTTVDPRTLVFHMKDGTAWKNTLRGPCPSLKFHGFEYVAKDVDQVCSNMQSIRVIETNQICALGTFTPAAPLQGTKSYAP